MKQTIQYQIALEIAKSYRFNESISNGWIAYCDNDELGYKYKVSGSGNATAENLAQEIVHWAQPKPWYRRNGERGGVFFDRVYRDTLRNGFRNLRAQRYGWPNARAEREFAKLTKQDLVALKGGVK